MTADLLTRARSAVTRDEECSAIRAAVCHVITDAAAALPLIDIIVAVRSGRAPAACLLGVVAALVPEGARLIIDKRSSADEARPNECRAIVSPGTDPDHTPASEWASTPALALLIAILDAANG